VDFGKLVLTESVEQFLFLTTLKQGFTQDFTGEYAALSALAAYTKRVAYFFERARSIFDGSPDLTIGYPFTEADVHIANRVSSSNVCIVILMRTIGNNITYLFNTLIFRLSTVDRCGGAPYNAQPRN